MSWTFNNIPFSWVPSNEGGMPSRPSWNRTPRLVTRAILGTGDSEIVNLGFEPNIISGGVVVANANAAAWILQNGALGTLTDGTTPWRVVATLTLHQPLESGAVWVGTATFMRTR